MMNLKASALLPFGLAAALLCPALGAPAAAQAMDAERLRAVVDGIARPLMEANAIPGMAVAVSVAGKRYVFNYGLASKKDKRPVDDGTLFEIGSISKTFTGTLGAFAQTQGKLSLSDPAARHVPELAGTAFDRISLLDLATYSAGGLPLQFPNGVAGEAETLAFFRNWRPRYPAGTRRLYSNPSIGLFGYATARSEGAAFETLMTTTLLPKLGLSDTFVTVPASAMGRYAVGTSKDGRPVRVSPGALDAEAYGIKTTASDLIRFVELAMDAAPLEPQLREAITAAQTGYARFGPVMQGLGWEIYDRPRSLDVLLAGNAPSMALEPQPMERLDPPQAPLPGRLVNKTGSAAGFGAYAAFVPEKRIGVAILANRAYPNPERVTAAWAILTALP